MFTEDDKAFLDRLGTRSEAGLSASDPSHAQLHQAISTLRGWLRDADSVDAAAAAEVDDLLDAISWACSASDLMRARGLARQLARAVRALDLRGSRSMSVLDIAQQIRALVVLAA